MSLETWIRTTLEERLAPLALTVEDESHRHAEPSIPCRHRGPIGDAKRPVEGASKGKTGAYEGLPRTPDGDPCPG